MKSRSPLRRKTRLSNRGKAAGRTTRRTKSRSSRVRDAAYLAKVRSLRCYMAPLFAGDSDCEGVVHAHHAGFRVAGVKSHDHETIPFCALHHHHWHAGSGEFKGWKKAERRVFANVAIAATQALLEWKP